MCTKAAAAAEVGKTAQEEGAILQVGTATTGHGLCFTGKHNKANSARNTTARRVCWHTTRHTESDGGKVAEKARKVLHGENVRNKHKTRKVFALKCRAKAADGLKKKISGGGGCLVCGDVYEESGHGERQKGTAQNAVRF